MFCSGDDDDLAQRRVECRLAELLSVAAVWVCMQVFQVCGQPSLGMRSKRSSSRRRDRGQGRRRGQGEGRRRRRRRTTPSSVDFNIGDHYDDGDEMVVAEETEILDGRGLVLQTTTTMSLPSTSLGAVSVPAAGDSWMNMTVNVSDGPAAEEHTSTMLTTVVPTSVTGLPSTTDSRPRRTRRPRRNRNRGGSRRRKNRQRTMTPPVMTTTSLPLYYVEDRGGIH